MLSVTGTTINSEQEVDTFGLRNRACGEIVDEFCECADRFLGDGDSCSFPRCQNGSRKVSLEKRFPFDPVCKAVSELMHTASSRRVDWDIWTVPPNQT